MSTKSVLVSGGTGLLGSHLIAYLLHDGKKIRSFSRSVQNRTIIPAIYQLLFPGETFPKENLVWETGELSDYVFLREMMHETDEVYHSAALVSFNPRHEKELFDINIHGTANMVNAALECGVRKFCHVSSTAALGKEDIDGWIDERSKRNQAEKYSAYSQSKFYAEAEVWRGIEEGLNAVIVNPSVIIGPGDWNKSSMRLFGIVEKGMPFYTSGVTGYVDVRDVSFCMIELMKQAIFGERFCIGGHNLSVKEVFTEIANRIEKKPPGLEAKPWMLAFAYRIGRWKYLLGGSEPGLTKDSARSAFSKHYYSSDKLIKRLNFEFRSVAEMFDYALITGKDVGPVK